MKKEYGDFEKKLHETYDRIETRYRPDLRWWLAEGLNTDETLRKNVKEIHDSGFGAAEFLAMPEPGADSALYGWGSEEWTSDTQLIIEEATRYGLGFSLTSGANWANANLPDTYVWNGQPYNPDNKAAAKELDYATVYVTRGERFCGSLPRPQRIEAVESDIHGIAATYREYLFQGVVAAKVLTPRQQAGQTFDYAQGAGTGILSLDSVTDLSALVTRTDGAYTLDWTAPDDGTYALFFYWMHGTGQTASPSVSTNYTVNYVDRYGIEALIDYWEEIVLTDALKKTIAQNGRGEIYMDSLEIVTYGAGGILWGYDFKEEFQARKGYDITRYLPFLTMDGVRIESKTAKKYDYNPEGQAEMLEVTKIRNDFYSVISDMYVENVLKPLQEWLHTLHMTLRAEPSYGMTYEISTPARYIDGIETESFAQVADIDLYRGMSGSAHMYGRIFSSETGAVPHRNYYYNMEQWTQLCFLQFATGVNRTVFHGYSAIEGSEEGTYWPGHEGMYPGFSERFGSRQPASIHYPQWTEMLGRYQKALRSGVARRDIAILRTDYFFINYGQPKGHNTFLNNYSMYDIPHFWNDTSLQAAGYTYDYFSPLLLEDEENVTWSASELQPEGPAYRAIILYQESIELPALQCLYRIAKGGLPIIIVNRNSELLAYDGTRIEHETALTRSRYKNADDANVQALVTQLKALPNVLEVQHPAEATAALQRLHVKPRVAFDIPNHKILTQTRWDEKAQTLYVFAYAFKSEVERDSEPFCFRLQIEGEATPYHIDGWSGNIEGIPAAGFGDGRTIVPLTLKAGEERLLALDFGSLPETDAPRFAQQSTHERRIIPLSNWDIVIEDWNEGDKVVTTEEKFGHITREVYYKTKKTELKFEHCRPVPWMELPAAKEQLSKLAGAHPSMAQVSGVGRYTTEFTLDEIQKGETVAVWIASAGGGTVLLYINGIRTPLVNIRTLRQDITDYVRPGTNTICMEVTSTLTNRMLQRDYKSKKSGWTDREPTVQPYGIAGDVKIVISQHGAVK